MEERVNQAAPPVEVVDIQFRPGQKVYFFDPDGKTFQTGDHVIMDTARGAEYGICTGGNHTVELIIRHGKHIGGIMNVAE